MKPAASAPSVRTDVARATATVIPLRPARKGDDRRDHPAIRSLYRWTEGTCFDAAFALVACREHPADFRPELLLWRVAQEYRHETLIARRMIPVVTMKAGLSGIKLTPERIQGVIVDAMRSVGQNVDIPAETGAKLLTMRKAHYLLLRNAVERSLLAGLRTALHRYLKAWKGELCVPITNMRTSNEYRRAA